MHARHRFRRSLGAILIAGLAAAFAIMAPGIAAPAAATAEAAQESEAVARYLQSGGRVPDWAKAPGFRAALSEEAERHGLAMVADIPAATASPDDGALIAATLRLARMLARGAVAPEQVQRNWAIAVPQFAAEAALRTLLSLDDPLPWLRSLAPEDRGYRELLPVLARYKAIAGRGSTALSSGPTLKAGMSGARVAALQSRLKLEGDLAADTAASAIFDAETERAVRAFQSRYGLEPDGRVGRVTLAAMNVDAGERYRQIAANLERWRWLPRRLAPHRVMVNAAAARLTLFEDGEPVLGLRTIVGKPRTPTPVLAATIASLLLNPPWDIPPKIAAHEIRPLARRDPGYLEREGIVAVGDGKHLRQLPGPKNALGRLKFEMPNPLDVYLHDTPSRNLFQRPRRFFSHGCIRVENPEELALRLLRRDPGWTREALEEAIATGETRHVPISPGVAVFVVYFTAMAEPGGTVTFLDDVYRRDPPLIAALFPEGPAAQLAEQRWPGSATECHSG